MIHYNGAHHFKIMFQRKGSVIYKALPVGIATFFLGLGLAVMRKIPGSGDYSDSTLAEQLYKSQLMSHFFSCEVICVVIGYLIVVRTNMALSRWMEGIGEVQQMMSTWMDAITTLMGFFAGRKGDPELLKDCLMTRVRICHYFSLMSCLAYAQLKEGNAVGKASYNMNRLSVQPMFPENAPKVWLTQPPTPDTRPDDEGTESESFRILHIPSGEELRLLHDSTEKVNTVCYWVLQTIVCAVRSKALDAPPPILSRVLDELSNSMCSFHQAHKVSMVPFPFPFAQMVDYLLAVLYLALPFFIDCFSRNVFITPVISCLLSMAFCCLNEIAVELEEPFGFDDNDVDILERHEAFLKVIDDLLKHACSPPKDGQLEDEILDGYAGKLKDSGPPPSAGIEKAGRKSASLTPIELRNQIRMMEASK